MSSDAFTPTPPKFDAAQLARMMEISSAVKCECPNHLSRIVHSLLAFEEYARDCESENAEDAAVHRMLYEHSAQARAILDVALERLVAFEGIEL